MPSGKIQLPQEINDNTIQEATGTIIGSKMAQDVSVVSAAAPSNYDDIVLTYTGDLLTQVEWKLSAATVKTATLTYTGDRLDRVQYT